MRDVLELQQLSEGTEVE
ncbi:class III lanthipeptide, partial [Bacillus amyloliquefaciens]